MADKYWVGTAGGNWAAGANWSPSGVPASADNVFFNAASGTAVVTISANTFAANFNCTGFLGTITINPPYTLTASGNVILSSAAKYLTGTGTGIATFAVRNSASVASPTVTTNGATLKYGAVKFLGSTTANIFTLVGALNCDKIFSPVNCTLALNSYVITCGSLGPINTGIGTVIFDFGGSGTSAIEIPTGVTGTALTYVVDLGLGVGCTSSVSGSQRPVIRLTYTGSGGSRIVSDPWNAFDYVWFGAGSNNVSCKCKNLNLTNFTGTMTNSSLSISGDLTFGATTPAISSTVAMTFNGTGTQNIDTKGKTLLCPVTFSGTGTYVLTNAMSMGSGTNTTTLTSGTLNLNGKTLTVVNFSSNNSNARGITFASGKIVATGTTAPWGVITGTNLTITGPGSIELTGVPAAPTTSRVFDGGSVVYNGVTLIFAGATAGVQNLIRGSNSFYSIRNTISPQTFLFVAGTTTIFTDDFELNGTAGNNIIITSQGTPSGQANAPNFAKPSGTVVCRYATISQNNAAYIGGALSGYTSKWNIGTGSTLASTTTGWGKLAGTAGFITFFYP